MQKIGHDGIAEQDSNPNPINSSSAEEHTPLLSEIIQMENELVTYFGALKEGLAFSSPFILTRLATLANNIGSGVIYVQLGADVIASIPIIMTLQYTVSGSSRSSLFATGILIGERFRKKRGEKEIHDIGHILRQSWIFSTILCVPTIGILATSGQWLPLFGIPTTISSIVQEYFSAFVFGVPASLWLVSYQQFAQGIKEKKVSLFLGSVPQLISILIGYPLALGIPGIVPRLGLAGFPCGSAVATWMTLGAANIYCVVRKDFKQYRIYNFQLKGVFAGFSKMLYLAALQGFQVLAEWGNLFLISMLSGKIGKSVLTAEEPSLQLLSSFNLLLFGLAQSSGILVSNALGEIHASLESGNLNRAEIWQKNAIRFGNAGVVLGLIGAGIMCGLFTTLPRQLSSLFINVQVTDDETLYLAQLLLLINGIGLLADSARNLTAGLLSGLKNVVFSPVVSLILMSVIALPLGYLLNNLFGGRGEWLFITRDIGILAAVICITLKWMREGSSLVSREQKKLRTLEKDYSSESSSILIAPQATHFKPAKTQISKTSDLTNNEKNKEEDQNVHGKEEQEEDTDSTIKEETALGSSV